MAENFYRWPPMRSITVRELIRRLSTFPPDADVVFKSPLYGGFGPHTEFTIDSVGLEFRQERCCSYPARAGDDETDKAEQMEAWTQVWPAWTGVVLS